jgi:hypothetical protein
MVGSSSTNGSTHSSRQLLGPAVAVQFTVSGLLSEAMALQVRESIDTIRSDAANFSAAFTLQAQFAGVNVTLLEDFMVIHTEIVTAVPTAAPTTRPITFSDKNSNNDAEATMTTWYLIACGVVMLLGTAVVCQLLINWEAHKKKKKSKPNVGLNGGAMKTLGDNASQNPIQKEREWWEEEEGEEYALEVGASNFLGVVLARKVQSGRKEVTAIQEGGLAAMGGRVALGDVLLRINDIEVIDLPEGGTQQLLVETRRPFILHFTRKYRLDKGTVEFRTDAQTDSDADALVTEEGGGEHGIEAKRADRYVVVLGLNSTLGIVLTRKVSGYKVVTDIKQGGLAGKYGAIEAGDVLERVGDTDVKELEEDETKLLLEQEPRPLTLKFRRPEERNDDDLGEDMPALSGPPDSQTSEKGLLNALSEQEQLIEAKPEIMLERERQAEKWRKRIQGVESMVDTFSGFFGNSEAAKEGDSTGGNSTHEGAEGVAAGGGGGSGVA